MFGVADGFGDGLKFVLDPLLLLISEAESTLLRHDIVPNLWAHFIFPQIEVEQELSRY